jgi:hypothetical protein
MLLIPVLVAVYVPVSMPPAPPPPAPIASGVLPTPPAPPPATAKYSIVRFATIPKFVILNIFESVNLWEVYPFATVTFPPVALINANAVSTIDTTLLVAIATPPTPV